MMEKIVEFDLTYFSSYQIIHQMNNLNCIAYTILFIVRRWRIYLL